MKARFFASSLIAMSLAIGTPALSFADVAKSEETSQVSSFATLQSDEAAELSAATKEGLVKKGSSYYFYKDGKAVKNAWKTVGKNKYFFKSDGKAATKSFKIGKKYFVFDKDGKLCKGKKVRIVTVKGVKYQVAANGCAKPGWNSSKTSYFDKDGSLFKNGTKKIGTKTYCFNYKGSLIKGDGIKKKNSYDYLFLCASSKGVYDPVRTKKLNSYCKYEKKCAPLFDLLGTPKSKRVTKGCNYIDGEMVDDVVRTYKNFKVCTFRKPDGTEYFMFIDKA